MGIELRRVIIPCEFLEPRSLLERLSDLLSHVDHFLKHVEEKNPEQRMLNAVRWFLSGLYIRPRGVKKPYNPVLGEFFRCNFEMADGSRVIYFAEQVSHHPPISAFYVEHKEIIAEGWYAPTSHFMGNSGCSSADGYMRMLMKRTNETYTCTWPDIYFRGILLGNLYMELCGKTTLACKETGIVCDIDFKPKPLIGGELNQVEVKVKGESGVSLYSLWGRWDDAIYLKNRGKNKKKHGEAKRLFLDIKDQKKLKKHIPPLDIQAEFESQRLWKPLTDAIRAKDLKGAQQAKNNIENEQREKRKVYEDNKVQYKPKFFKKEDKFWSFIGKDSKEYQELLKL